MERKDFLPLGVVGEKIKDNSSISIHGYPSDKFTVIIEEGEKKFKAWQIGKTEKGKVAQYDIETGHLLY